jgi:plastocyanin
MTVRAARARVIVCVLACLSAYPLKTAAGDLHVRIADADGKPLADAVISARPLAPASAVQAKPAEEVVEQIDKEFVPRVKAVLAGSRIRFPNRDSVRHQVYSFSAAKKFELPLYSGTSAPTVVFDMPGVVVLGCNIHDWMVGYIYVADTPYFTKTSKDGSALLKDLPAGDYNIRVWQPNMVEPEDSTARRIAIARSGTDEAVWRIAVKAPFKIRRAPAPGGGAYR